MPYYKNQMKAKINRMIAGIKKAIHSIIGELQIEAWVTPGAVPFDSRMTGVKKLLQVGEKWGNPGNYGWFHFTGQIPPAAPGKKVVLLIDIGGEACIVNNIGSPVQGLTNKDSEFDRSLGEPGKRAVYWQGEAGSGEKISLWIQGTTNDLFGKYRDHGMIQEAYIALSDDRIKNLYYDLAFLNDLLQSLPIDNPRADRILFGLYDVVNILTEFVPEKICKAQDILTRELRRKGGAAALAVSALGNSHIDLAWLWPVRESIQKGARTFSTALLMMERYPDYIFGASQPQLYQWIKTFYPELYGKIKARVKEGRWETLGAMWVEADTNIPGGEALIRQILYGKRFFAQEFNRAVKILWLPDSFGFNGALPQIAKKSGIDYFCTTKLSWNVFNQYPHHTFIWKGIDGSGILVHMPPEGTYNSSAAPRAVIKAEKNYLDKGVADSCLMLFGIGDGGGGPGEEHLEWLKREKDLDGLAPVRQEPAQEFFDKLAAGAENYQLWDGELYLERHQGTYTTQARNKRFNRKTEVALRDLEFWAALVMVLTNEPYPASEIETIWKEVLLYQFHDIIAGSAIHQVYQETLARYEILLQATISLNDRAWQNLIKLIDTSGILKPVLLLNSTSWERTEWAKLNGKWFYLRVPSMGYAVIDGGYLPALPVEAIAASDTLENDILRIKLAEDGSISEVFDKEECRQVLAPGFKGNRLAVYDDDGDAWDIPIGYADKEPEYFRLDRMETFLDGPRAFVKQVYKYGNSILEQEIGVVHGSRRIDFVTRVDWREKRKMLRSSFAVNVRNTEATCEIQFGNIKRPNNHNTTWEMAKYEIPAQKWIDLSDSGYGVSLLNDCKYGHKIFENVLDINLLRSPVYPDPEADTGIHEFVYALYPHRGNHVGGGVSRAGCELNIPLRIIPVPSKPGIMPGSYSFVEVAAANIAVETVKRAEDEQALIIRLYEHGGLATKTGFRIHCRFKSIELVDLMENRCDQSKLLDGRELYFDAFEIHTLKVRF